MSKPWESVPHIWKDEKAYCNWLRGQIRRMWKRHPVKIEYINSLPSVTPNDAKLEGLSIGVDKVHPNTKVLKECEMCSKWFPKGHMVVDHLHGGDGFSTYEEFLVWQEMILFLGFEDIQYICKPCHHQVSMSQKFHCSLEDVEMYIKRADFRKANASKQQLILKRVQQPPGANKKEREAIYCAYLEEKHGHKFNDT